MFHFPIDKERIAKNPDGSPRITDTFRPTGASPHYGIDYSCVEGCPIYAMADGMAYCATQPSGFGLYVRITTGEYRCYTAHLRNVVIPAMTSVRKGQLIGYSGNTGNSSGGHVHTEVRRIAGSPYLNGAIDPAPLIDWGEDVPQPRSKIGIHFQNFPNWGKAVVNESAVEWVKIMAPGGDYPFTRPVKVVGRVWIGGDDVEMGYVLRGAAGGDAYFERCWPEYQKAPWVTAWEGPNEPTPFWGELQQYNLFAAQWIRRMHLARLQTVAGCISVGQPAAGHIHLLRDVLETTDYFATHEYAQPTMQQNQSWLCLRYRRLIKELTDAGIRVPPWMITEAGIDGGAVAPNSGIVAQPKKGWKTFATREQYKEQKAWYDTEVCKDPIIVMWCPFTAGPANDWVDFEVDEQMAREDVARHNAPAQPQNLPSTDAMTLAAIVSGNVYQMYQKRRWWNEESVRQLEQGNTVRALAILKDMADPAYGLDYIIERALQ